MRNQLARLRPRRLCRGARGRGRWPPRAFPRPPGAERRGRAVCDEPLAPVGTGASPRPSPVGPCWVPADSGPGRLRFPASRRAERRRGARPEGRRADRARRAEALERRTANGPFPPSAPGLGGFLGPTPGGAGKSFARPSPPLAAPRFCPGAASSPCTGPLPRHFPPGQAPLQPQLCPQLPGVFVLELPQFLLTALFCYGMFFLF